MSKLVSVGSFCPDEDCPDYGETEGGNIIRYGKTGEGRQRFHCRTCKHMFNERKGTLFYNRKTDEKDILECLALFAEGVGLAVYAVPKGIKEDTILSFLREAALHAEQVEMLRASCIWEEVVYTLTRSVKTLRLEVNHGN